MARLLSWGSDPTVDRTVEPSIPSVADDRAAAVCSSLASETAMTRFRTCRARPEGLRARRRTRQLRPACHRPPLGPRSARPRRGGRGVRLRVGPRDGRLRRRRGTTVLVLDRADEDQVLRWAVGRMTMAIGLPAAAVAALGSAAGGFRNSSSPRSRRRAGSTEGGRGGVARPHRQAGSVETGGSPRDAWWGGASLPSVCPIRPAAVLRWSDAGTSSVPSQAPSPYGGMFL